jgi:hypothetical protein
VSKHETALSIVTSAELERMVGDNERLALYQHRMSTDIALSNGWLKFHNNEDSLKHAFSGVDVDTHAISDTLERRLSYLQDETVKSALLGFWLHDDEFEDAKRFRDERVVPMLDERLEPS